MSGEIVAAGRSADGIATEIRVIVQQTRTMMAAAVIEVGKRLIEAQQLVPHGEWGEYVTHSCGFSQRTAQAYMQLAANPANAQTIADLPYSKALALLALPEGKVEEFRAEHPVEDVSVRELKRQISEYKDRLEKAADAGAAQQQLLLLATEENGALKQRLNDIDADYKGQLDTVDRENDRLRAELEAAKNQPVGISEMEADKIRSDGWGKGYSEGLGEKTALERQLEQLKNQMEEQSAAMGRTHHEVVAAKDEEIAELKRQLSMVGKPGAPSAVPREQIISEIKSVVAELQASANRLHGHHLKLKDSDPELAASVQRMVEKLISNLYTNFGIDPI